MLANYGGVLKAQNYVGVLETSGGTRVEILPKIDFADSTRDGKESTRRVFLRMLRTSRDLGKVFSGTASIRDTRNLDMLEVYIRQFLDQVVLLARRGLVRAYRSREANLPFLRGRILFPSHLRSNLVDQSNFYVEFDELTANRPANRLIRLTLQRLARIVRLAESRQLTEQLRFLFSHVPASSNPSIDLARARDRADHSMRHYENVMQWVQLFLFDLGFAPFSGDHRNPQLVFPMESVFEDFVANAIWRYQNQFEIRTQAASRALARDDQNRKVFWMRPDIALMKHQEVRYILDTKWKRLIRKNNQYEVSPNDVYQLFAYGRGYKCKRVMLVYPWIQDFQDPCLYRFAGDQDLELLCFPFDVSAAEESVHRLMDALTTSPEPSVSLAYQPNM